MTGIRYLFYIFMVLASGIRAAAQFPPPAGEPGSTAIPADSACFKFWADSCIVLRGYVNYVDTTVTYEGKNRAFYGTDTDAKGVPDEYVVSLGDKGSAVITFPVPIGNGPGFDFAVFENSISNDFLELGFVEVSSDGIRFIRFPGETVVQSAVQVTTFGTTDATKIHNFAGKYRALFGTPFDLSDLKDSTGIDLQHVTHVRIIDVGGCVQEAFASLDSKGNIVNDPWPTPFHSSGFDIDAVGVINTGAQGTQQETDPHTIYVFPNPAADYITVSCDRQDFSISVCTPDGKTIAGLNRSNGSARISLKEAPAGLLIVRIRFSDGTTQARKVLKK